MPRLKNILNLFKEKKNTFLSGFSIWREEFSWPRKNQWARFFKIFTKNEKYFFTICVILFVISFSIISINWYLIKTEIKPANGGQYVEASIGFPRYLNPVLASSNDVDRDISAVIYSSLFRHDETGKIMPELVEKFSLSQDRKTYDMDIKKNIKWHDGKPLTAEDIVYTANIIQNPDYRSPLKSNLQGVEILKTGDYSVRFILKNPYDPFLENLSFGILPKHIWENIPPASFPLSENNLKPIGSGPYQFSSEQKDNTGIVKSLELDAFDDYFSGRPYINSLIFQFYKDENAAISAFNNGGIDGLSFLSAANISGIKRDVNFNKFNLPRYFAVFFNPNENKALLDKNVRQSFNLATNKQEIIDKIAAGQASIVNSPLPNFIFNENSGKIDAYPNEFDFEQAKRLLDSSGWIISQATTSPPDIRSKKIDNQDIPLEINLLTVNWPELIDVANILKSQWEIMDVKVNIDIESVADIQEKIKSRQYQAILFGQVLGANPDPFSFWHSSQTKDPGLNLAMFSDKEADKLLENIRKESNFDIKIQEYNQFQKLVVQNFPAVFLYSPTYIFPADFNIKGINLNNTHLPQDRFAQAAKWYIKTKRAWR